MSLEPQKGHVRLYACGGGGINVGFKLEQHRGHIEPGFADIQTVYIDTSLSNMKKGIDPACTYMLDGLDGSGKVRAENYQVISERIRDILQKHAPLDINIVLSTAAGGSGSVIAPSIVSELLDRNLPVIVIAVGSAETKLDAHNTLNTLKSYEGVAKLREAPVVMAYFQNGKNMPRSKVDDRIYSLISGLCGLYSRQNRELDSRDLYNWLRFERVTTFKKPQLAALTMLDATSSVADLGNVISVATIGVDEESVAFPQLPEYQCTGFVPEGASKIMHERMPLHFVTHDGVFAEAAEELNALLKQQAESSAARLKKPSLVSDADGTTENGLVL